MARGSIGRAFLFSLTNAGVFMDSSVGKKGLVITTYTHVHTHLNTDFVDLTFTLDTITLFHIIPVLLMVSWALGSDGVQG